MFVLMIILSGTYTSDVIFHEYSKKENCEVAMNQVKHDLKIETVYCNPK